MVRPPFQVSLWAAAGLLLVALGGPLAGVGPSSSSPTARPSEPITPVPRPAADGPTAELGEALFKDVRLSHGDARSCASCHDLATNGATAARLDAAPDGTALRYNTPSVFDAALEFRQDWEGDLRSLENQADASIQSPSYMASTWDEVLGKLRADRGLTGRFVAAYGRGPDRSAVIDALAAYERTLVASDSRFDRWLRGDDAALTAAEQEGYRLFKYVGCTSCHQGVAVGGNLFQRTDVFQPLFPGRARRMRVASLRDVAVTGPYLDDGSAATLNEAVDRMGKAQLGTHLKPEQVGDIVAFLRTLTGRYRGRELTQAASAGAPPAASASAPAPGPPP